MTDPNVRAARGLTRHCIDWLDGDTPLDWPWVTPDEAGPDDPTPLFWETVWDLGTYPEVVCDEFDFDAACAMGRHDAERGAGA